MLQKYSTYIFCFLLSLLIVALYVNNFSPLEKLEWKIQDMMYSFKSDNPRHSDIILVDVDQKTLDEYGDWPWRHDQIADLIAAIGSGEPKTILLDIPLMNSEQIKDSINYTDILAGQMSWVDNIIIPYEYTPAEYIMGKISNPKYLYNSSIEVNNDIGILEENQSLLANRVFLPPESICRFASGLGFRTVKYDEDKKIRWEPLALHYQGYYYPSAVLLTAAHFKNIPTSNIAIFGGEFIQFGNTNIPTNENGHMFINYNSPGRSFVNVPATDILNEFYDTKALKNKLVIISITAEMYTEYYKTPVGERLIAAEKTANVVENIIHSNFIKRVDSTSGVDVLLIIGLGIIFAFVLPRMSLMYRAIIVVASFIVFANVYFVFFNSMQILPRSLYIFLELFVFLIASPFLDKALLSKFSSLRIGFEQDPESTKLPKVDLPRDKAIKENKIKAKPSEKNLETEIIDNLPKPQPAEQKRVDHSPQATTADGKEISSTTAIEDSSPIVSEPTESKQFDDPHIISGVEEQPVSEAESHAGDFDSKAPASAGNEQRPADSTPESDSGEMPTNLENFGRYKVLGVLGKGAMGTVYKGVDPAIDRNVALKTIRLDFVNDPADLAELKERLSREAKAAGMLSHPNIVTIYDVGTEGNLQYIAMEYLEGQTLEDMIRKKTKFNYKIIAQIITQICTALDFAHSQGIVHRDIKPANIMVLQDYRIKVMDFGIARVDSSSMTRTGIAMGTPNYISPEQLQGKPIDKRCDIFSLGVVMYEMLLGRRPFRGENLTSLIYSIVNNDVELPSTINKAIPHMFDRVIEKALTKDPENRYQHASEISAQLSDFIDSFVAKH